MMQLEDAVVSGVTELVRIYIILEYFKIFLNVHSLRRNIISCVITYIITLLSYLVFHNVLVNLIVTVAGIIFLSGGFRGKFKKKLLLSIMLYAIMFVIDLLASFLLYEAPDSNNYDIVSSFMQRGYNSMTFLDENMVDLVMTDEQNLLFLYPSRQIVQEMWGGVSMKKDTRVFLSHSSKDKKVVDEIFNQFQINEIDAWYDKYQIEPGDSVTEKINQGLEKSDIGIICISNNFLNSASGWTKNELNYFIQRRMRNPDKPFIVVNFDVPHNELPPLVQDYKYIDFSESDAMEILVNSIKKRLNK